MVTAGDLPDNLEHATIISDKTGLLSHHKWQIPVHGGHVREDLRGARGFVAQYCPLHLGWEHHDPAPVADAVKDALRHLLAHPGQNLLVSLNDHPRRFLQYPIYHI